jgi:hypothetical protein
MNDCHDCFSAVADYLNFFTGSSIRQHVLFQTGSLSYLSNAGTEKMIRTMYDKIDNIFYKIEIGTGNLSVDTIMTSSTPSLLLHKKGKPAKWFRYEEVIDPSRIDLISESFKQQFTNYFKK